MFVHIYKSYGLDKLSFHPKVNRFLTDFHYECKKLPLGWEIINRHYNVVLRLKCDNGWIHFYKRSFYFFWKELPLNGDEEFAFKEFIKIIEDKVDEIKELERQKKRINF